MYFRSDVSEKSYKLRVALHVVELILGEDMVFVISPQWLQEKTMARPLPTDFAQVAPLLVEV